MCRECEADVGSYDRMSGLGIDHPARARVTFPAYPMTAAPDLRQHLEVETPEHVTLDLEIAGVGSRVLAALIDGTIVTAIIVAGILLAAVLGSVGLMPASALGRAWAAALTVALGFAM